jgi:hypothetical protein
MKIDLSEYPIVMDLFPNDSDEGISVSLEGSARDKLRGMPFNKAIDYIMENYDKTSRMSDPIKNELEEIFETPLHWFQVYTTNVRPETDGSGNIISDPRVLREIDDTDFFQETKNSAGERYLISEIHAYTADAVVGAGGYK